MELSQCHPQLPSVGELWGKQDACSQQENPNNRVSGLGPLQCPLLRGGLWNGRAATVSLLGLTSPSLQGFTPMTVPDLLRGAVFAVE